MIRIKKSYPGVTLVEVVATIVVTSSIVLGMMIGLNSFFYHYQQERVKNDVYEYGRMVLDQVVDEINTVAILDQPSHFNGYAVISGVKKNSQSGGFENFRITGRKNAGILFNNELPLDGSLELPDFGSLVDQGQRTITLEGFEVYRDQGMATNRQKYFDNSFDIELSIGVLTSVGPGIGKYSDRPNKKIITFRRRVFVPNSYIGKLRAEYLGGAAISL